MPQSIEYFRDPQWENNDSKQPTRLILIGSDNLQVGHLAMDRCCRGGNRAFASPTAFISVPNHLSNMA